MDMLCFIVMKSLNVLPENTPTLMRIKCHQKFTYSHATVIEMKKMLLCQRIYIKINIPSLVIFIFNQKKLMRYVNMRYANMNINIYIYIMVVEHK